MPKYLKTDRANKTARVIEIGEGDTVQHSTNENFGLISFGDIEDFAAGVASIEDLSAVKQQLESASAEEIVGIFGYTIDSEDVDA